MFKNLTMRNAEDWYKSEFEKLGWMILAKHERKLAKITQYKINLDGLIKTLEKLELVYEDADRKKDINTMLENTKVLKDFVDKKLKIQ
jgi:hypothetical protein